MEDTELRQQFNRLVEDVAALTESLLMTQGRQAASLWLLEAVIRTHPDRSALSAQLDALRDWHEQPLSEHPVALDQFHKLAGTVRRRCEA